MALSLDEARLIAVSRAVGRAQTPFVPANDVSVLAEYLVAIIEVAQLDKLSEEDIERVLDGYVAGFAACRMYTNGYSVEALSEKNPSDVQSGVDAATGKVRGSE